MDEEDEQYIEMRRLQTEEELKNMVEIDRIYAIDLQATIDNLPMETRKETFMEALFGAVAPMLAIIILQWLISG
ncbi:hypothetical protein PGAG_00122 [Phaeocystis globosa virus 12T]|uniref:Uncharacterized protein n=1 Tax=Phaeocystis globosa virus PgV-16T TaxID=3071227 RepID=A0AC59EX11_9VIRU|nr:hypothetical protein PGCG_00163 [Phaeocystis globosa virus]AET73011.1 hypothetical protein PGAG_00122 [Phaeocystis globosa virus 12T]AET73833.1 hypothetical protein PGBG_00125 [Phaeocystis globosa virus 14T]AGM15474.1 hypothetical protein PGCG_00163 [Phaeocystis globosa virus PgV-16T]UYE94204.1 hypothetical protein PGV14T_00163 [Phaeocystis globosa virus]